MASIQGWGRETWGSGAWSEYAPINVTGQSATATVGTGSSVSTDQFIVVTGQYSTATAGDATAAGIAFVVADGQYATASTDDAILSTSQIISVTLTDEEELTASLGDTTETGTRTTGWNRDTDINTGAAIGWGDQQWGAVGITQSVTGQSATASTEDVASVTGDANQTPDSQVATWTIGTYSVSGDNNITIVASPEHALTASTDDVTVNIFIDAVTTGQAMTASVGDATAPALAQPTGVEATASAGDLTQETIYTLTGVSATVSLGQEGTSGGAAVSVTGNQLTSSVGSLRITNWSIVDDSQTADWKNVSLAA
jgi:hypothetical protein